MVLYFNYFAIIVMIDQCWGSSQLIPTAVYSQSDSIPAQYRKRNSAELLSTGATNYYPIFGVSPNNPSFEEMQYAASFAQPNVHLSNGDIKNLGQKKANIQKPEDIQRATAQVENVKTTNIKYMPTHSDQRPNLSPKTRSSQTKVNPLDIRSQTTHQKLTVPMILKSGTPISPNYYQMISRPSERKIEPELNSTFARVQSSRFNGLKYGPQILQNYSQNHQTIHRDKSQTQIQAQTQTQLQPQMPSQSQQWTSSQPNLISKRQKFGGNQQNFRFDSTHRTASTETPTFEREINPLENYRDISSDTNSNFGIIPLKEESRDSENKKAKLTSIDSENSYQTQNYDSEKTFIQNDDQNQQINNYGSPTTNNNEFALPDNELNYSQSESEAESETTGDHYSENDKELIDINSVSQLKSLLEQFIQQLDHLKLIATKELYKSYDNNKNYRSKSDDEVIQPKVTEPLFSKSGSTYDHQNFEQGLTNTESTNYRDTHQTTGIYEK